MQGEEDEAPLQVIIIRILLLKVVVVLLWCAAAMRARGDGKMRQERLPQKISVLLSDGAHASRSTTPPTRALMKRYYLIGTDKTKTRRD